MSTKALSNSSPAIFFDTSFFSEARFDALEYFLEEVPGPKYITKNVHDEIKQGYIKDPKKKRFSFIFGRAARPRGHIKIISFKKCTKDLTFPDFKVQSI
jgi:hypothetical protein